MPRLARLSLTLLAVLAAAVLALCSAGCVGINTAKVQRFLDATLPPSFTGDFRLVHNNPYIDLRFAAGGLRRQAQGWEWDWVYYWRRGRMSEGSLKLGDVPANALSPLATPQP